jgi:hypothetical protein
MSAGAVEMAPALAPAPAGDFQNIVRVEKRETSGCDGCEPNEACQDYVLQDDMQFPAYKNTTSKKCLNRDSMLNVIRYRMPDGFSRDPATKARLNLPEDLANLIIDPPAADEEEEWPQYEQDAEEDPEDSDFEEVEMDDADDDIFDIDNMARSIGYGYPEYAVAVYNTTKHHVKEFDTKLITRLWELGMHVEAQDLYARTLQFVEGVYSFFSIEELWKAGMEEQAWQLHILKARWLPEGEYPAYMIIHYLRLHMHKLAQSLHDRTISVMYDVDVYDVDEVVECMVSMNAFGMKDQARELYELTLKVEKYIDWFIDIIDWFIIMKLKKRGMELEAAELLELKAEKVTDYDAANIIEIYVDGFDEFAGKISELTVHNAKEYDWRSMSRMIQIGMLKQAIELHKHTLKHARDYDARAIKSMADAGMGIQARELHDATLLNTRVYDVMSIITLLQTHTHGDLEEEAGDLHEETLSYAKDFNVEDIMMLHDAEMETQAGQPLPPPCTRGVHPYTFEAQRSAVSMRYAGWRQSVSGKNGSG